MLSEDLTWAAYQAQCSNHYGNLTQFGEPKQHAVEDQLRWLRPLFRMQKGKLTRRVYETMGLGMHKRGRPRETKRCKRCQTMERNRLEFTRWGGL